MGEGWHFTDWGYKVTTQDQLTRAIARIGTLSLSRKYVWRGVPDHRWRMNSSLYRSLTEQLGREPDVVYLPVGGGGLLAGCLTWLHAYSRHTRVVGVEPAGAAALAAALDAGRP